MRRMVDDKEMITIDNRITALEQGGGVVVDAYTKAQTDALLLTKVDVNKHFDDDDNPEDFYIKQPQTYSGGIELHASRDDNHHPDYANLAVTPTHVIMLANSANHGDNDDDYTGSIDITDSYVDIEATDGTNTTTLRVAPNGVTVNGSPIGGGGSTLYRHTIFIKNKTAHNYPTYIKVELINADNTVYNNTNVSSLITYISTRFTNIAYTLPAVGLVRDSNTNYTVDGISYNTINSKLVATYGLTYDTDEADIMEYT